MDKGMSIELIGFGYVINDKVEDSYEINIYPTSTIPTADGNLNDTTELVETNNDVGGNTVSVKINKSVMITARWLNEGNSYQLQAPSVCEKEIVKLYKIAGLDIYWWDTIFTKPEFRKREKSLKFFSSKSDIDEAGYLKKGYFFLVDTFNKLLHLHTSESDGEYTTYDMKLDTKGGVGIVKDGKGNYLALYSTEDGIVVHTKNHVTVKTTDANVLAENDVIIKAGNNVNVTAKKIHLN